MATRKAVVAMSGGVDSSVAAALLVEQGYDVTGIMLKLWKDGAANGDSGCCSVGAADDARRVADVLGIPFYVFNFAERFESTVIRDFHDTYADGRTPNPCVRCNQWIKFDTLLERSRQLGADILATGHYARVREVGGSFHLLRGRDRAKDQSYVLWMLTQAELRHVRFPVGDIPTKAETRAIAQGLGLRTADKPDSQEICFVRGGDVGAYIESNVTAASVPGPIRDRDGNVLGQHPGIGRVTIGQRKGLGIALGEPVFVTRIDRGDNSIVVGRREDLAVGGLTVSEVRFVGQRLGPGTGVLVQHRAHGEVTAARVVESEGDVSVVFQNDVDGIAPGQSAAFYCAEEPDRLLGGGIISSTFPADRLEVASR